MVVILDHNLPRSMRGQSEPVRSSISFLDSQVKFLVNLCDRQIPLEASKRQDPTDSDRFGQWLRWHWTCRSRIQKRLCHPEIGEHLGSWRTRVKTVYYVYFTRTNAGWVPLYTTLSHVWDDWDYLWSFDGIASFSGSLRQSWLVFSVSLFSSRWNAVAGPYVD